MLTQLLGCAAMSIGWLGTLLVTRTRHAWLIAVACSIVWAIVDIRIQLWSALAAAIVAVVLNWRCWLRHVTAQPKRAD